MTCRRTLLPKRRAAWPTSAGRTWNPPGGPSRSRAPGSRELRPGSHEPVRSGPRARAVRWAHDGGDTAAVTRLVPWEVLLDRSRGAEMPLRGTLAHLYGTLRMPSRRSRPYVVANFASTLDGVVSLQQSGTSSGGEITG